VEKLCGVGCYRRKPSIPSVGNRDRNLLEYRSI
jgi:hypothetical protein